MSCVRAAANSISRSINQTARIMASTACAEFQGDQGSRCAGSNTAANLARRSKGNIALSRAPGSPLVTALV